MSLDALGEAPTKPIIVGHRGVLLKKSGGKAFDKKSRIMEKWTKRFFVLPPGKTVLSYYKNEASQMNGDAPLGDVQVWGSTVFLKAVKSGQYRFTVRSAARELKLRARDAADYDAWMGALQPITEFREDDDSSRLAAFSIRDEDDEDDFDAVGDDVHDDDDDGDDKLAPLPLPPLIGSSRGPGFSLAGASLDDVEVGRLPEGMRGALEKKSGGKAGQVSEVAAAVLGSCAPMPCTPSRRHASRSPARVVSSGPRQAAIPDHRIGPISMSFWPA